MIPETTSLKPLDDQGVRHDRPTDEVKYSKLYNCTFHRGRIRQRPAMRLLNFTHPGKATPIIAFGTRKSHQVTQLTEYLFPNVDVAGTWESTDPGDVYYTEIDEDPADGTEYMNTSTPGAKGGVGFENLSETYTQVVRVTMYARVSNASLDEDQVARLKAWRSTSLIDVEKLIVSEGTPPDWTYLSWPMPTHPQNGQQWQDTWVDSFNTEFEFIKNQSIPTREKAPIADGSDSGWTKPTAPQTNKYLEIDEPVDTNDGDTTYLLATASGTAMSVSIVTNIDTLFTDVDRVAIAFALKTLTLDTVYQLYYIDGTSRVNWGAPFTIPGAAGGAYVTGRIFKDEDPRTETTWAPADLNGFEYGIRLVEISPGLEARLSALELTVDGWLDVAAEFRIDQAYLRVDGWYTAEVPNAHIMLGTDAFMRNESPFGGDDVTDVQGSATDPTTPSTHHWDDCEFEAALYFCNGKDQIYRYPKSGTDEFEDLPSGPHPTGATIESFADRLVLGDILESGQRVKDQLRWCKWRDPEDWADATAGDLRLRQTPGAVIKVKNLLNFMVAYKETGIYNCIHRADPNSPILATVQDPETGCLAMASVKAIGGSDIAEHVFLGTDLNGTNIFKYNGDIATPIGKTIIDEIREKHTRQQLINAFGVTDPDSELYLLFICQDGQHFPKQCYVYSDRLSTWIGQWHFPHSISAAGTWYISRGASTEGHLLQPTLVLGTTTSQAFILDPDELNDIVAWGPSEAIEGPILQQIETGDMPLGGADKRVKPYEMWVSHIDNGLVTVSMKVSQDGGETFLTEYIHSLGTPAGNGELRVDFRNVSLDASRRVRFNMSNNMLDEQLDLVDIQLEAAGIKARRP